MHFRIRAPLGLAALAVLLATGCMAPRQPPEEEVLRTLQAASAEERDEAFQRLLRDGGSILPRLKASMGLASSSGFPIVAILYAHGEGDAVPLELRARHLAAFAWPRLHARENAVVEPYVLEQLETDLVRAGHPMLRLLAQGLASDSKSEELALRAVHTMLRIGGRAALDEFARLLSNERSIGESRVCDVAAAALLHAGRQEPALRLASRDSRLQAAREWWARAKDQTESEWTRDVVAALAERCQAKDTEGIRGVLELLTGQTIDDPKDWRQKNPEWSPSAMPLRPEALIPLLSADRPHAYDANYRLELLAGARVFMPRMTHLSELLSALRLWQAPSDLPLRWKRYLEVPLLRLSIVVLGHNPQRGANHVRWSHESYFHPLEDESGELRIQTQGGIYALFVQARDLGTQLVMSEEYGAEGNWRGAVKTFPAGRPRVEFSLPLKSAVLLAVDEVPGRRAPRPPDALRAEWRARLREMAGVPVEAESRAALRALGYIQAPEDAEFLKERRAGEALLLLGDPAALEYRPALEPHEIEMALRKAEDPRVREYLEELRAKVN